MEQHSGDKGGWKRLRDRRWLERTWREGDTLSIESDRHQLSMIRTPDQCLSADSTILANTPQIVVVRPATIPAGVTTTP